jgi:hypothetical protein
LLDQSNDIIPRSSAVPAGWERQFLPFRLHSAGQPEFAMRRLVLLLSALSVAAPALATETITYTYDARGRLKTVARTGSVNSGVTTQYTHDRADNRTHLTTTGSSGTPPP